MPRRKRTRRERRERQEQREEAAAAGVPVREKPAPVAERKRGDGVSFSGAAGGLLGAGLFFAIALGIVIDLQGESRPLAIPFAPAGLCFFPSILVSVLRKPPRRRRVLRITTVGAIVLAMLSIFATGGFEFAVLLAPPTALLAIGAGYIFQGSGRND